MRIRTVKPEFWMHEGLCKCSEFSRLLAVALLNWSDDEGYFMANPILIRGQVFPFEEDSKKVPRGLQELSGAGWIRLGKDDQGRSVGMVINFAKHQRVDKPKASSIKASSAFQDPSKNDLGGVADESQEEGNGKEQGNGTGKGKEHLSASADDDEPEIIKKIWPLFPAISRSRSSKLQLEKEWAKVKPKPSDEDMIDSIGKWANCHEWTKDSGQFAPGAHLWVRNRKWEVDPAPAPTINHSAPASPQTHAEARQEAAKSVNPGNRAQFSTVIKMSEVRAQKAREAAEAAQNELL